MSVPFLRSRDLAHPFSDGRERSPIAAGAVTRQSSRPDDWRDIWPELAEGEATKVTANV